MSSAGMKRKSDYYEDYNYSKDDKVMLCITHYSRDQHPKLRNYKSTNVT